MEKGKGFIDSVQELAKEKGLPSGDYVLNSQKIVKEIVKILKEDYSQTLMISAVLGQLVESKGEDRFPPPAFFVFLEILSEVTDTPRKLGEEPPANVDDSTTRIIELTTTLVSLICEWNVEGCVGVAKECPDSLKDLARAVFRKTKLLQSGMWTCVSCGKIVEAKTTRALLCPECDSDLSDDSSYGFDTPIERDRTGYGRTSPSNDDS
jgi:predicted Zn-ribbon and HTH transcriptional regulator